MTAPGTSIRPRPWQRLGVRLAAGFLAVTVAGTGLVGLLIYRAEQSELEETLGSLLLNIARTGALLVDPTLHAEVEATLTPDSEAYRRLRATLAAIQDENRLETPIYTLTGFDPVARRAHFMMTSRGPGVPGEPYELVAALLEPLGRAFGEGAATHTRVYENQHGTWITAFAPVRDARGRVFAVLDVDYRVDVYLARRARLRALVLGAALAGGVLALALGLVFARRVTGPIAALTGGAVRVAAGDFSQPLPVRSTDEVGLLTQTFNEMMMAVRKARVSLEERLAELTALSRALGESEARKSAILESALDGIVTMDHEGRITEFNPAAERTFGHRRAEVLGRDLADTLIPPALRDRYRQGLARYLETGEGTPVGSRIEVTAMRADGTEFPVEVSISRIRTAGPPVFTGFLRDTTERRRLEDQLRQSQKMEAVGQLAGGVAHDFNNLLTVINGRSLILLHRLPPDDPRRRDVELIEKTAERAAALTRQLLAFSRKQLLDPRALDLSLVVADMEPMLTRLIGEDVALSTVPAPIPTWVRADRGQLDQVVMNLAVNARDAMPRGGRLTIAVRRAELGEAFVRIHPGSRAGLHVALAVSDTGIGMSAEIQARIFEPFFTTKEPGVGTGLGLATVYGVVKQSQGYLAVESAPGQGTTFTVYLPAVDEPAAPAEPVAVAEAPAGSSRGSESILLVEDEAAVRQLAREILEHHGYRVVEAGSASQALLVAESSATPPDLLLTDVVMPGISGRELAERLTAAWPGMKVLYMSGYTTTAIARYGVLDTSQAFLQKPFTPDALARKVREVLDGSGAEAGAAGSPADPGPADRGDGGPG